MNHGRENGVIRKALAALGRRWRRPVLDEETSRLMDAIDRRTPEEVAADTKRLRAEYGAEIEQLRAYAAARLEAVRWKNRREVGEVSTTVPARLDQMPWTRFHSYLLYTFAASWAVFGVQVGLSVAFGQKMPGASSALFWSLIATGFGALAFGRLADRLGRRAVLFPSLALYALGAVLTPFARTPEELAACRVVAGLGIGGEYVAMTATVMEFVPKAERGRRCLSVHASFWLGAALAAFGSAVGVFDRLGEALAGSADHGWRFAFGISAALCLAVFFFRSRIKESPRWLASQGHLGAAERIVDEIEGMASREEIARLPAPEPVRFDTRLSRPTLGQVWEHVRREQRVNSLVCLALMAAQAAFYNGVSFGNADVLEKLFQVPEGRIDEYLLPLLLGNFLGPVVFGHLLVDRQEGRRLTIFVSFLTSGVMLAAGVGFFHYFGLSGLAGHGAATFTLAWTAVFFFASAGASTVYLLVGETFPQHLRAQAFAAVFFLTMVFAGVPSSLGFRELVQGVPPGGPIGDILVAYLFGAGLLVLVALAVTPDGLAGQVLRLFRLLGFQDPAGRSLEEIANPLRC